MARPVPIICIRARTIAAGNHERWPVATHGHAPIAEDSPRTSTVWQEPGKFNRLRIRVSSNGVSGGSSSTYTFRVDGAAGMQSMSIPGGAGNIGWFEDDVGEDSVDGGETVSFAFQAGAGGSVSHTCAAIDFTADRDVAYTRYRGAGFLALSNDTGYIAPSTFPGGAPLTVESSHQVLIPVDGVTARHFAVGTGTTNARTNDTVFRSRVNGADGACEETVPGGVTSTEFVDAISTDPLDTGDLWGWSIQYGAGTQNLEWAAGVSFEHATVALLFAAAGNHQTAFASNNAVRWIPPGGWLDFAAHTTESAAEFLVSHPFTLTHWSIYLEVNTRGSTTTYTVRRNGVDTGLVVTCSANGGAGWYHAAVEEVSFEAGDILSIRQSTAGGGGNILPRTMVLGAVVTGGASDATGDAAPALPAFAIDAAGTVGTAGDSATSLPALNLSGGGSVDVRGATALTLPPFTATATSEQVPTHGTASTALPALTIQAAAAVAVQGATARALRGFSITAAGIATVTGTAATDLPAFGLTGGGTAILTGAATVTLPAFGITATSEQVTFGGADASLPRFVVAANGQVENAGGAALILPALGGTAAGQLLATGGAAVQLAAFVTLGHAALAVAGGSALSIPALRVAGTSEAPVPIIGLRLAWGETATRLLDGSTDTQLRCGDTHTRLRH